MTENRYLSVELQRGMIYNGFLPFTPDTGGLMSRKATPITGNEWIRRNVFGFKQTEIAELLGISQTRWMHYEVGGKLPYFHKETLRKAAAERGILLKESWFAAAPCVAV